MMKLAQGAHHTGSRNRETKKSNLLAAVGARSSPAMKEKKSKQRRKQPLPDVPSLVEERRKRSNGEQILRTYKRGKLLGKGGFARCYLFTCCETDAKYAGKVVAKKGLKRKRAKQKLLAEIRTHQKLDHPHIVKFRNYFEDRENVYIMLEVCHCQTLMELVRRRKRLTEQEARYYSTQILDALQYLHSCRIIHRDLKLGNLFLDKKLHIKVGDFGLAAKLEHANERKKTICGTPNYIAPEILVGGSKGHSYEVDIWSFGCILYTMIIGKPPFQTRDVKKTYKLIKANTYSFPEHVMISESAKNLIRWILSAKPEQRPTICEINRHPFFAHALIPKSMPLSSLKAPPTPSRLPLRDATERNHRVLTTTTTIDRRRHDDMDVDKENVENDLNRPELSRGRRPGKKMFSECAAAPELKNIHAELHKSMISCDRSIDGTQEHATARPVVTNSVAPHESELRSPDVWVTQWVDYSTKYGLGYLLSDGSVGVYFNDSSKIVMASNGEHFEYMERSRRLRSGERAPVTPQAHVASHFPDVLNKKVTLLKHFRTHLFEQQARSTTCCPVERAARIRGSPTSSMVYVKKWVRTRHAVLFRVSNRTVQVSFFDKTEVLLSSEGRIVTFRNKEGERSTFRLDDVMKKRPDIAKRLKYTKEILHQLIKGTRK